MPILKTKWDVPIELKINVYGIDFLQGKATYTPPRPPCAPTNHFPILDNYNSVNGRFISI